MAESTEKHEESAQVVAATDNATTTTASQAPRDDTSTQAPEPVAVATPPPRPVISRNRVVSLFAGLIMAVFVSALDETIVGGVALVYISFVTGLLGRYCGCKNYLGLQRFQALQLGSCCLLVSTTALCRISVLTAIRVTINGAQPIYGKLLLRSSY